MRRLLARAASYAGYCGGRTILVRDFAERAVAFFFAPRLVLFLATTRFFAAFFFVAFFAPFLELFFFRVAMVSPSYSA
jgi:hypothetical protein